MSKISIISAKDLDYDEYVDVQIDAYSSHLKKYDVSTDFINRELFEWKYAAPAGYAKMAIAHEGQSIVAVVATIPLWVGNSENRALLWAGGGYCNPTGRPGKRSLLQVTQCNSGRYVRRRNIRGISEQ